MMRSKRLPLVFIALLGVVVLRVSSVSAIPCQGAADCDDGNDCTQNRCVNGSCAFLDRPMGTKCADDGNDCTRDLCQGPSPLTCQHVNVPFGSQCGDDGNECTRDACGPDLNGLAACLHQPVPFGSLCGDDGNPCTADRCGPDQNGILGCQHTPVPFGSPCPSDDNDCTVDICAPDQGSGMIICAHQALQPGSLCGDDGSDCTFDFCEPTVSGPICRHQALAGGTACDDQSPCTQFDVCDSFGSCLGTTPVLDCRGAAKASLSIKNKERNSSDQVTFNWLRGEATELFELGDPTTTTTYTLCVFDGNGRLQMSASAPPAEQCGDDLCWTAKPKGYAYSDSLRLSDGIGSFRLAAGLAEKSSAQVRGKGNFLPVPVLPLVEPVRVQVVNDETGVCFQSDFGTALSNTDGKYQAKTP